MRLHRRPGRAPGYTQVVVPGRELQTLGFGLLRLQPGESYSGSLDGVEACLVIISGTCDIAGPGLDCKEIGRRTSVFAGKAYSVYLPSGSTYTVTARTAVEVAVATSPTREAGQPKLITPDDVVVNQRGKPGFAREVHDILDARTPAARLVVGETFNSAGEWSSYPPHKHDETIPDKEARMEEVYFFQVEPEQGFGVQVLYSNDGALDEAYMVKKGDVTILPFGYHPVAAAPGYRVYYLWIMAGEGRTLIPNDDPAHAWVKNV